jgi:hypothetical protein
MAYLCVIRNNMYIYVTFDPLLELVLCVHDKPNQTCKICGKKKYAKRKAYNIYKVKRKVVSHG